MIWRELAKVRGKKLGWLMDALTAFKISARVNGRSLDCPEVEVHASKLPIARMIYFPVAELNDDDEFFDRGSVSFPWWMGIKRTKSTGALFSCLGVFAGRRIVGCDSKTVTRVRVVLSGFAETFHAYDVFSGGLEMLDEFDVSLARRAVEHGLPKENLESAIVGALDEMLRKSEMSRLASMASSGVEAVLDVLFCNLVIYQGCVAAKTINFDPISSGRN